MKKIFNISNIYIAFWCLYNLNGILYPPGSVISQCTLGLLLGVSMCHFLYANLRCGVTTYLKVLNFFILFLSIYGFINLFRENPALLTEGEIRIVQVHEYLKNIYISLLPIYSFYVFSKRGLIKDNTLRIILPIYLVIATVQYWHSYYENLNFYLSFGWDKDEFTNNTGYAFLSLIPLLYFWKRKPIIQYLFLGYIAIYIIMSAKRGAMLTFSIALVWFLYTSYKNSKRHEKRRVLSLIVLFLIGAGSYVSYRLQTSEYLNHRIEKTAEGDSSNREYMYTKLWQYHMEEASAFDFFVGGGADKTCEIGGNLAHNDWLELLVDNGILGVMIYILYWIAFVKEWRRAKGCKNYEILGCLLIICFIPTLFSMGFNNMRTMTTLCLGYCLCKNQNKEYINDIV